MIPRHIQHAMGVCRAPARDALLRCHLAGNGTRFIIPWPPSRGLIGARAPLIHHSLDDVLLHERFSKFAFRT